MRLGIILLIISCLTIPICAEAATYKGKAVGIIIEKSCLSSDKCLKYSDIIQYDNTDPVYMGGFIEKDGDIARHSNSKQNNYKWLDYEKNYTIIVDPPLKFYNQIPLITILSKLDEYHDSGQYQVKEYKTIPDAKATKKIRYYSHTRYVDSGCNNAFITAKDWHKVLNDTIQYLKSGCDPSKTKIKTIANVTDALTKHDISTSYKWKDQKWRDQIIQQCTKARNSCTNLVQPTRAGL